TPVDRDNRPDLGAVVAAARTVGGAIAAGGIVVLESTVYPGVTEDVVGPAVAAESGLVAGRDFFLGYSPERINPGDKEHTVERITKVVAGQTPAVARRLAAVYGAINGGNVFVARDIRTAEAAKVIENAQRDVNIAFMNEVATIFNRAGLSVWDVIDAARTKWNFLPFQPGLVGGHCIGVDPYYLASLAQRLGHDPQVILSGRKTNDGMAAHIARAIGFAIAAERPVKGARVLVLGLAFKENVPDIRNSKVADVIAELRAIGCAVEVCDPLADAGEVQDEYGLALLRALPAGGGYDAVIGAVAHDAFKALDAGRLAGLLAPRGILADVKGMWRTLVLPEGFRRWQL
ncbi:MAG: nucleotide sugar dehydrogenase, partial [Alphaproteobacteria bacterium]|nr:nucleotide sugar dehydrogenase [Alphaproteobacteria bacterium]